jgi:hypothetical protein
MHISNSTRPDIAFAVHYLAMFMSAPTTDKDARLKDVLLYLKGSWAIGIRLGGSSCVFHGFRHADFAGCKTTRRSTTAFVVRSSIGSIAWKSSRQATVSRSSTESEYIAAVEIAKEVQYLVQVINQFGIEAPCVSIGIDNMAARHLILDPVSCART